MEDNIIDQKPTHRRPGSLLWPLLLIIFGILLLLDNINLLSKSVWGIFLNLWPIIFIALGLDGLVRKQEIFSPVFWLSLGGVFLLSNFGIVSWSAWHILIRLWPILLITAGLEILFGKRAVWVSLILTIFLLGMIVVILWGTESFALSDSHIETTINEQIGTPDNANITIRMAIGDLNLFSSLNSNTLISGKLSTRRSVCSQPNQLDRKFNRILT